MGNSDEQNEAWKIAMLLLFDVIDIKDVFNVEEQNA
jgi:hypothetical protein